MELSEIQAAQRDKARAWGKKLLVRFPAGAKVQLGEVTLPRQGDYKFVSFNAARGTDVAEFTSVAERFFAENEIFLEVKNAFGLTDEQEGFIDESGDELIIVTPKAAIKVLGFKTVQEVAPFRLGPAGDLVEIFQP